METAPANRLNQDLYNLINEKDQYSGGAIKHRHYFQIAGITVCLENDTDADPPRFKEEHLAFATDGPGDDNVTFRHHFRLPDLKGLDLGLEVYRRAPWAIYHKDGCWIYRGILPMVDEEALHRFAVFNADYTRALIFSPPHSLEIIRQRGFHSLSLFPTDQIWLTHLLADREAVLLHSAAAIINGQGFIFVGHSDAGKSTTIELLQKAKVDHGLNAEVLCDDRNILRRWPQGWYVHGTWSHGDISEVSPAGAPLKGVLFLEQAKENRILPLTDRKVLWKRLLAPLIRAAVSPEWWQKELDILEDLIGEAPFYRMQFDKTGAIVPELERLAK